MTDTTIAAGGQVGRSLPRLEARAKATGRAEYVHGMRLPGMLYGKIFRSTVAHGRIKTIDTSAAKQVPGVYRVVTADDGQKVLHLAFEPFVSIADAKDTSVTLYTSSQGPSFVRTEIARLLGWPENRVRIKVPFIGSGYGSKLYIKLEALVTALSLIARRPVKVALTMEEMFYQITKHPSTFRIKSGVDKDGKIIARKCEVFWNGGAYADVGPRVTQKSGLTASGPYDIDNVSINSYALYTNVTPAGALRGFGVPQLVWAYESHTDMMARALKLDPVAFRRKNLLREGRPHPTGTIIKDAATEKVFDKLIERMNWSK